MAEFIEFHVEHAPKLVAPDQINSEEKSRRVKTAQDCDLFPEEKPGKLLFFVENKRRSSLGFQNTHSPGQVIECSFEDADIGEEKLENGESVGELPVVEFPEKIEEDEGIPESQDRLRPQSSSRDILKRLRAKLQENDQEVEREVLRNKKEKMFRNVSLSIAKGKNQKIRAIKLNKNFHGKKFERSPNTFTDSPELSPEIFIENSPSKSGLDTPSVHFGAQSRSRRVFPEAKKFHFELFSNYEEKCTRAKQLWDIAKQVFEDKVRRKK